MNKTVSATHFKAHCLKLLDEVAERGDTLTVTKHNKAVAKVTPVEPPGSLLGSARQLVSDEELIAPIDVEWEANA